MIFVQHPCQKEQSLPTQPLQGKHESHDVRCLWVLPWTLSGFVPGSSDFSALRLRVLTSLARHSGTKGNLEYLVLSACSCKEVLNLSHLSCFPELHTADKTFKWNLNTCSGGPVDFRFSAGDYEVDLTILLLSLA